MNNIFTRIIAETVARTTMEMVTGQRPKFRRKQVVPKEKLRGGLLREVRVASPARRSGEVRIYAA